MDRVQDAEKTEEDNYELSLRPKYLREYIGQKDVKENIDVFIKAAKLRDEPLDDARSETSTKDVVAPNVVTDKSAKCTNIFCIHKELC